MCLLSNMALKLRSIMPESNKELTDRYNKMFSDYLIDCCLWYELGVARLSDFGFTANAKIIAMNWDRIDHHHKERVDIEKLKQSAWGGYIQMPHIVRTIACKIAMDLPNGPMYQQTHRFVHEYCEMKKIEENAKL